MPPTCGNRGTGGQAGAVQDHSRQFSTVQRIRLLQIRSSRVRQCTFPNRSGATTQIRTPLYRDSPPWWIGVGAGATPPPSPSTADRPAAGKTAIVLSKVDELLIEFVRTCSAPRRPECRPQRLDTRRRPGRSFRKAVIASAQSVRLRSVKGHDRSIERPTSSVGLDRDTQRPSTTSTGRPLIAALVGQVAA
jgi:hypothetical protein